MGVNTKYQFRGSLANGTTTYVGVTIDRVSGSIGAQISWLDATSAATITLELTNYDSDDAASATAGSAWMWKDSGLTITGPTASAAGSTLLNLENIRQRRARLKIVTTALSSIEVTE